MLQPVGKQKHLTLVLAPAMSRGIRTALVAWRRGLRSESVRSSATNGSLVRLWRPAAFTIVVGCTSYGVNAIYMEEKRFRQIKPIEHPVSQQDNRLEKLCQHLTLGAANTFVIILVLLNIRVFLLWRVPELRKFMEANFLSRITHIKATPHERSYLHLMLSSFSHLEFSHLAGNMLWIWMFAPSFLGTVGDGKNMCNAWPYYLTAATFASMISHYSNLARRCPFPSAGASGALMAVATLVVFNNPNALVYWINCPIIPIPASWVLTAMVYVDLQGLLRKKQGIDFAVHLGGTLFAVLYHFWLHQVVSAGQSRVATTWHKLRSACVKKCI